MTLSSFDWCLDLFSKFVHFQNVKHKIQSAKPLTNISSKTALPEILCSGNFLFQNVGIYKIDLQWMLKFFDYEIVSKVTIDKTVWTFQYRIFTVYVFLKQINAFKLDDQYALHPS